MESAEQAEGSQTAAPSRQKRSRAGCLTCRTRRRKCDEGRPECQNCKAKGFECRYAAAFQILGKNNFTPEVPSSVKYTNLRFISEDDKIVDEDQSPGARNEATQLTTSPAAPLGPLTKQTTSTGEGHHEQTMQQATSLSAERYEVALHGLLALGSGSTDATECQEDFVPPALPAAVRNIADGRDGLGFTSAQEISETLSMVNPSQSRAFENWPLTAATNTVDVLDIRSARVLEMLKHYRYHIAPWLDICDANQTFGCEVMQLSKLSTSIRYVLLALTEASLRVLDPEQTEEPSLVVLARMHREDEATTDKVQKALLDALDLARNITSDLSRFWSQSNVCDIASNALDVLLPGLEDEPLAVSVFWLVARIQLSVALMNTFCVTIPVPATLFASWENIVAGAADQFLRYSHDAVALCVEAITFSRGDENGWLQRRYGLSRVEVWKSLLTRFEQWYRLRPQDFHPVIELYPKDGRSSEDEFPTIVFSSGAATLATQLYHTGMLLLLQNKPRFIDRAYPNSCSMSLLWHTHRICGIATNNDRWDCWDPSLLASLFVAARTATHGSQHSVILRTLEKTQRLTRWNLARNIEQLRYEWQQAESW